MVTTREYTISQLAEYIDWSYFLHTWQLPAKLTKMWRLDCSVCRDNWIADLDDNLRPAAQEATHLVDDSKEMLRILAAKDSQCRIIARVGIYPANSHGEDILITDDNNSEILLPCLRQQHNADGRPNLCLADFISPKGQGKADRVGVFATTVQFAPDEAFPHDDYLRLMAQTVCDRLAEAAACLLHEEVRKHIWGYAADEHLSIRDMLLEYNVGIRPAVGYPSLPDQSLNFLLAPLVGMSEMGITLTENGAMRPHASVSGLMIAHPQSRYFAVGKIDTQQLNNYALRRGLPIARMRQFLQSCIYN